MIVNLSRHEKENRKKKNEREREDNLQVTVKPKHHNEKVRELKRIFKKKKTSNNSHL